MDKLLLVSCCAPCSIGVIHKLKEDNIHFSVLFYNPNIRPIEEYQKRLEENKRVCDSLNVPFIELEYEPQEWEKITCGLENEPERGKRCENCFYLRLKKAALYAKENGFSKMTSVLGISRYKDFDQVTRVGKKVEAETGVIYDETNWRKNGLLERTEKLSKDLGLYRQNYCGCKPRQN